ncbi:MAG: hypothetical protein FWF29_02415 [Treponema sp.]|nr:hypothetical protein [Treponema sp.]
MPTNIEHNGKMYCWNQETEEVEEIVRKPVDISKCPVDALRKLMSALGKENSNNANR